MIALLVGVGILPVFGRFSNTTGLLVAKRKIRAALYAFRLFGDEPRLVFRAQGQLLLWNARYLGMILKPAAIVVLPIGFLLVQMDAVYGHRALRPGETAIVSARMADNIDLNSVSPVLTGDGISVDTQAIRVPAEHKVYWRVRALQSGPNAITLDVPAGSDADDPVQKIVQTGGGLHFLAGERTQSAWDWLANMAEPRLRTGSPIQSIAVSYPDAVFRIFGIDMPWILWFVIVSWTTMFALRKRFGVVI